MTYTQTPLPTPIDPATGVPVGVQHGYSLPQQVSLAPPAQQMHLPVQALPQLAPAPAPQQVQFVPAPQQLPMQPQQVVSEFGPGVVPAQPVMAADVQPLAQPQPLPPVTLVPAQGMQPPIPAGYVPAAQVDQARQTVEQFQGRIEQLGQTVEQLNAERQARLTAEQQAQATEHERQRLLAEQGMDARQLIEVRTQEMQQQVQRLKNTVEVERALREKESNLALIAEYKRNVLEQVGEYILPELRDFIVGDTTDQIDASVQDLINRSAQVMGNVASAYQPNFAAPPQQTVPQQPGYPAYGVPQPLSEMRAVAPTGAAPVGPMEQQAAAQVMDPGTIRNMSMSEYRQRREQLLGAAAQSYYQ